MASTHSPHLKISLELLKALELQAQESWKHQAVSLPSLPGLQPSTDSCRGVNPAPLPQGKTQKLCEVLFILQSSPAVQAAAGTSPGITPMLGLLLLPYPPFPHPPWFLLPCKISCHNHHLRVCFWENLTALRLLTNSGPWVQPPSWRAAVLASSRMSN